MAKRQARNSWTRVWRHPVTRPSVNGVFVAVFSIFILALVVLIVLTLRWAIKSDRAAWRRPTKKD